MKFELKPHPDFPPRTVKGVDVWLRWDEDGAMELDYIVDGEDLTLPEWSTPQRSDDLWRTTCFELFFKKEGSEDYIEFNFSPSSHWAVYAFDGYRSGRRDLSEAEDPDIQADSYENGMFTLTAEPWPAALVQGRAKANIAAVIEEKDGTISYWALAHPPGKPDFHDPACFVLELPAPHTP